MRAPPASLRRRGAVQMVHPIVLKGSGLDRSAEVGITEQGGLVVRIPGGLFGTTRMLDVAREQLEVSADGDRFELSGGGIATLALQAVPGSSLRAVLDAVAGGEDPTAAWGPGPGWTLLGHVHPVRLELPDAPPKPCLGRAIGRSRSTPLLWRDEEGGLLVDDPDEPFRLAASVIRAVTASADRKDWTFHALLPGGDGWCAGLRIKATEPLELEITHTEVPRAARAVLAGHISGAALEGCAVWVDAEAVVLVGADGAEVGRVPREGLRHNHVQRWLLWGPGASLVGDVPRAHASWLLPPALDPGVVEVCGGPAAGAAIAELTADELVVHGSSELRKDLHGVDPDEVSCRDAGEGLHLEIEELVLQGGREALSALREGVLARGGRTTLQDSEIADLYRTWHELRIDRWLWWIYGPVFLTDQMLNRAHDLPPEPGEEPERHLRRKIITETLLVAEQVRAVRLRVGAAPAALPYALVDEEADWLDALTGGRGAAALQDVRTELLDGFRLHLRGATSILGFALADVERSVARLEPVHHPELRGGQPSVWGRVGLGAAMMLLSPISGTITIAHAVVGKVTDRVSKDQGSQVLVDRFGPQCRASWSLLVDVAAIAALETRAHLQRLLARLVARDRRLHDALPAAEQHRVREQLIASIQELRAMRAVPLEGLGGQAVGDVIGAMHRAIEVGPVELVERLTGRGAGAIVVEERP